MAIMRGFVYYLVLFCTTVVQSQIVPQTTQVTIKGEAFPSLTDVTLQEMAAGLESGLFTSIDLVNTYFARITEANVSVHAVTELNPDALSIAAELDAERANGTIRGPLHGIPILIKNNIATMDQMNNTAGSYALLGAKVPRDSTIASKLRKAGAIILGKTNLSQWANYRSFNSTNGWSAYGGQVYAAYYPNQDPSGSSSGSGVSSSLGLAFAALGTETDGSIVSPSEKNGLVGIKPSVGLTSRYLVIPISEHQDTVGPMARTVKDAAYILQQIAGPDPNDNYTSAIPNNGILPDYVAACNFSALSGARIGIPWNAISMLADNTTGPMLDAFSAAVTVLKNAGATVINNTDFPAAASFLNSTSETLVLNTDFIVNLATYLSELTYNPENVHSLADVRNYTHADPREDWPDRDTLIWDDALFTQGWNNTDPRFWTAYQQDLYFGGAGGLLGTLSNHSLDAVIMPTSFASSWAAIVGAPIVTVPMGYYPPNATVSLSPPRNELVNTGPNVPIGLSFLGARFDEATLIGLAYAYEQRTHWRTRVKPFILPNTELSDIVGS